jgi:glycerate kinase
MPVIVIAPDSYKGSLSAQAVACAMEAGIRRALPDAAIRRFPMADGGEGTLDAVLAARSGEVRHAEVADALLGRREARFALLEYEGRRSAVIEVAGIVGLPDAPGVVAHRSSRGVGELLRHCLALGIRQVMVGLGGSSTSDGGAGVLAALGVRLLDAGGGEIAPTLAGLERLDHLDFSGLDPRLAGCDIILLADVDNPLCGEHGATAVFGPQKGVAAGDVDRYDGWIAGLARHADSWAGQAVSAMPGAGAAGGIGYALRLLGARMESGAAMICQLQDMDSAIRAADWVLTGEGRSDAQTLRGKAPYEVARRAHAAGKPVSLLSGAVRPVDLALLAPHFSGCFSIIPEPMALEGAIQHADALAADAAEQLARLRFLQPIQAEKTIL